MTKICPQCSEEFQPASTKTVYCSHACRYKYWERDTANRFWRKVNKTESCWFWTGAKIPSGYGSYSHAGGSQMGAHRYAWINVNGNIPDNVFVLHKCDVKNCVNPDHLFLGSQADNVKDAITKGRWPNQKGTHNPAAKLNEGQVEAIRQLAKQGHQLNKLAVRFNVTYGNIYAIVKGKSWKHT